MCDYPVSLSVIGQHNKLAKTFRAVKCENLQKTISMTFFGPEPFFPIKLSIFYWLSLPNQIGDYTVSLSAIEALQ